MRTQYINNVEGFVMEVDTKEMGSYGVLYGLLDEMKLEPFKEYDVWSSNGVTLIAFLRKIDAMQFKLSYPWSSGPKS